MSAGTDGDELRRLIREVLAELLPTGVRDSLPAGVGPAQPALCTALTSRSSRLRRSAWQLAREPRGGGRLRTDR